MFLSRIVDQMGVPPAPDAMDSQAPVWNTVSARFLQITHLGNFMAVTSF
jgi:hypothetical protein